jgi:methyl coenzyme M reductase subunit C-like uncharacterized protein (methanogenesis marker protein 7)
VLWLGRYRAEGVDGGVRCVPLLRLEVAVICAFDLARLHKNLRCCAIDAFLEAYGIKVSLRVFRMDMVGRRVLPVQDMIAVLSLYYLECWCV